MSREERRATPLPDGDRRPTNQFHGGHAAPPSSRFPPLVERPLPPLDDEIHLYTWNLDRPDLQIDADWMSRDERNRAERFRFERDRGRFRAARQTLRWILGSCCGSSPDAIRFDYGGAGKPYLFGSELAFNLSHSAGRALLAVVSRGPVGVDLEEIRPIGGLLTIAERYFSPIEAAELTRISGRFPGLARQAFFRCWTRKEAFLKASGAGLSEEALRAFAVSCHPDEAPRLLIDNSSIGDRSGWSLTDVAPYDGFVGAVVTSGSRRRWSAWELGSELPPSVSASR